MVPWGFQGATIGENIFTSASMGKIFETTEPKKVPIYWQADLMVIKKSNFVCVNRQNISQFDSCE